MFFKVLKNKITWTYRGEEVLVEGIGSESIRVRAAYKKAVDENRNYNILPVPTKDIYIMIQNVDGIQYDNINQQTFYVSNAQYAKVKNGKMEAVIDRRGAITFLYNEKIILDEDWIDEYCGMPPFQKAREYRFSGGDYYQINVYFKPKWKEHIYGMGQENTGCFDLQGCTIDLCQKNTKCTIPFYMSSYGYGFLWNNPAVGRAEFVKNRIMWEAKLCKQLDYFVIGGGNPSEVMKNYTELTGRIPDYPKWILGLWQSKLRYRSQEEVLNVAREYIRRKISLSVLVIDYFHWPNQGDWRFDDRFFPKPDKMVEELKNYGIHLMVSIWPTVDPRSENYTILEEKGLLVSSVKGPDILFMCRGPETYLDITNPEAGEFLYEKIKQNYIDKGITSFWLDEAEPEIYPYDYENIQMRMGNGLEASCYYPYAYNKNVEIELKKHGIWNKKNINEQDGIILVRSGGIGSQRLRSVIWSGDVPSTFESLRKQLIAGLQMAVCGITFWTTDIGGFYGGNPEDKEFRELMVRWFQFGVFCPVLRMHGYRRPYKEHGNMNDMSGECNTGSGNELWSFGPEVYEIMVRYIKIRERLIPYIESCLKISKNSGLPVMRPLFFDYPEDEKVYSISDEYMFGHELLVAPILEYGISEREVYLPKGMDWIDKFSKKFYKGGGTYKIQAPIDVIPVFQKIQ